MCAFNQPFQRPEIAVVPVARPEPLQILNSAQLKSISILLYLFVRMNAPVTLFMDV